MTDWPKVEIESLIAEGAISILKDGNHGSNYPRADEFVAEGFPFLTAKFLSDGRIDIDHAPRLSAEKAASFRFGFVRTGDVLLSHNATVGRVAIMPGYNGTAVIGTSLTQYRVNPDKILPEFLAYYFSGMEFQNSLSFVMSQSTRNQVPITQQRKLSIRYPSLDIQKEIVAVIKPIADKIELNQRMSATLEGMARALFRSWFVDFDPVQAKARGEAPAHMDPATAALFPDRFGENGLPEGWSRQPLSEVCTHRRATIDPGRHEGEVFEHFSLPAYDAGAYPVRQAGGEIRSQKLVVPAGTILFSRLNPSIPRVWWPRPSSDVFSSVASTEFLVAAPHKSEDLPYLYAVLSSDDFRTNVLARVTGTSNSHQRVKPGSIMEIEVPIGGDAVRLAYSEMTRSWFDLVAQAVGESQTLAALRDALLPKLMSGEIRVRDAARLAAEAV